MELTTVLAVLGGAGGLLALARLVRGAWRVNRRIVRIAEAVTELSPNSGHSVKDTVHRIEEKVDRTREKVDGNEQRVAVLAQQLEDHIRNHPGG